MTARQPLETTLGQQNISHGQSMVGACVWLMLENLDSEAILFEINPYI